MVKDSLLALIVKGDRGLEVCSNHLEGKYIKFIRNMHPGLVLLVKYRIELIEQKKNLEPVK